MDRGERVKSVRHMKIIIEIHILLGIYANKISVLWIIFLLKRNKLDLIKRRKNIVSKKNKQEGFNYSIISIILH